MPAHVLRLEVAEFADLDHWRWVLKDSGGAFLADHSVALNHANSNYAAMVDLPGHLRHYATPLNRDADERRLIQTVGAWIGEQVLGRSIGDKLIERATPSVVVRVAVPPQGERLLALPLEIARFDDNPLSVAGVSFIFETTGKRPLPANPVGDRLRILALFSLPPTGSPLNLRRERQMLRSLVRRLTGACGSAIELRVLQYGVTRSSLRDALEQGESWDVIHFSGHGQPGSLVLEKPDGSPDLVPSTDLAKLLREAGSRLKLVVLSACLSAAASIDQTLGWLGFTPETVVHRDTAPVPPAAKAGKAAPMVAHALTGALDCAVLAMRYAVEDEFAMTLGEALYDRLFRQGQTLPRATQLALRSAVTDKGGLPIVGALSAAAPALFGPRAADLTLVPPQRPPGLSLDDTLAYLPRQPEHFVGRVAAMTRASVALAAESPQSGVLFHGMAGAGKTGCAVELAYHHAAAGRFRAFVWYAAPEQGKDIVLALREFALAMERQLPGLRMVHVVDRMDTLRAWLPRLVEVLEYNALLIVLDNAESLLTEAGQWRDERWGLLVDALLTPGGLSRALLTSRTRPVSLPVSTQVIAVHALPRDEALLLVRELPNLRCLLDGGMPGLTQAAGRQLVRRVLRLVQGHPKLIQLAEALAKEPSQLTAQLARSDAAQSKGAGELDAFFQEGETRFDPEAFLASLRGWTSGIAGALTEAARTFFHFLCALEEGDREGWMIQANWGGVWQRLGCPGPVPEIAELLTSLVATGLVDRQTTGPHENQFKLVIHPGVAEAGRAEAGATTLQAAVDRELAAIWQQCQALASEEHGRKRAAGSAIVRAGLSAFPYLGRLAEWGSASAMLEKAVALNQSPDMIAAVLPLVRRIADETTGTAREATDQGFLAKVLGFAGRLGEAEALLRELIAHSAGRGKFATASTASGDLVNLLLHTARPKSALRVVEHKTDYTRRAGHGPWTQLLDEVMRLQILNALGKHAEVLGRVTELREQMHGMPDPPEQNESVAIWNVREVTWDTGRNAAQHLGEGRRAISLNAEVIRSMENRGAGLFEQARARFNDFAPLLRLRRYDEARELLRCCRAVFEQENDVASLGAVFSALATVEVELSRHDAAKLFEETALSYKYVNATPEAIAVSHSNLGTYLSQVGADWRDALGHQLAAALIHAATWSGTLGQTTAALADDLRRAGEQARLALPPDFATLCAIVQKVEGVRFKELMGRVTPAKSSLDEQLQAVIGKAVEQASADGGASPN